MNEKIVSEFVKCLVAVSFWRAGWDFQLPPQQRDEETASGQKALARAREIWAENPDSHDDLRVAFKEASPLATMSEIEN